MADQPLSFDDGQAKGGAVTCTACGRSLTQYWTVEGVVLCEECKEKRLAGLTSSEGAGARFGKAALFGAGGMVAGAAVWAAVEVFGHIQLALIAILLGVLVGKGVFKGSGGRGGRRYQFLALALTWIGYGLASTPSLMKELVDRDRVGAGSAAVVAPADTTTLPAGAMPTIADSASRTGDTVTATVVAPPHSTAPEKHPTSLLFAFGALGLLILALPGIAVFSDGSIILAIIYGIGLWEAWKLTRAVPPAVSGPHTVASGAR